MKLKVWVYRKSKSIIRKVRGWIPRFHKELVYSIDLHQPFVESHDIIVRKLEACDLNSLQDIWPQDYASLRERVKRGDVCYSAFFDENLISYHWVQTNGRHFIQPLNQQVKIETGDLWIYHVRVSDAFRGKGIAGKVYTRILSDYKKMGYKKVWIYTGYKNISNQKSLKKTGFNHHSNGYSIKFHDYFISLRKATIE